MLFNSIDFLVFFPAVTALFFVLRPSRHVPLLLLASCVFYMAFRPAYILILLVTIVTDYFAGLWIERSQGRRRALWLWLSVAVNVGFLGFFKYFNFLNANLRGVAGLLGWGWPVPALSIVLPIGLSFHTFQAMSYTIEVYRGRQKAETSPWVFALYVLFFPQLVAGPIERPQNLLSQFRAPHPFDYRQATDGLKLMAWGLFKKMAIADRLTLFVDQVYASPAGFDGPSLLLATVLFAAQIYCDFSGYSDIALGSAQVMGFRLMRNFDRPYAAGSLAEFWRRWHISLSSWLRDYLFLPLVYRFSDVVKGDRCLGVRSEHWINGAATIATFLVCGLWHGANWTFVCWGLLHGLGLTVGLVTRDGRKAAARAWGLDRAPALQRLWQVGFTFSFVCVGWVVFRARSLADAWYILTHLGAGFGAYGQAEAWEALKSSLVMSMGGSKVRCLLVLAAAAALPAVEALQARGIATRESLAAWPAWMRWTAYYALVMATLLLAPYAPTQFIYFQF